MSTPVSNTAIPTEALASEGFDYAYVPNTARVAVYEDLKAAPRILEIAPTDTKQFIENLADCINDQKTKLGGTIPYTVIREVTENFIHAQFSEIVVSVLDQGNTIRFCDQGPGIANKDKAVKPGFTSASEPMKDFIRGVGSGLPIVKEYLDASHGQLVIEDNIVNGAVVTISMRSAKEEPAPSTPSVPVPLLSERELQILELLSKEGALGNKEVADATGYPLSTCHGDLKKLEEAGLIELTRGKKRMLTDYGFAVSKQLF